MKIISNGGYFKRDTELKLINSYDFKYSMGLFEGVRVAKHKREIGLNGAFKIGDEYVDQEKITWSDVTIIKDNE